MRKWEGCEYRSGTVFSDAQKDRSTQHLHHIGKNKKEHGTEQDQYGKMSDSSSLSDALRTCAETRALTCSGIKQNSKTSGLEKNAKQYK